LLAIREYLRRRYATGLLTTFKLVEPGKDIMNDSAGSLPIVVRIDGSKQAVRAAI
jgi:hypothetical protein